MSAVYRYPGILAAERAILNILFNAALPDADGAVIEMPSPERRCFFPQLVIVVLCGNIYGTGCTLKTAASPY